MPVPVKPASSLCQCQWSQQVVYASATGASKWCCSVWSILALALELVNSLILLCEDSIGASEQLCPVEMPVEPASSFALLGVHWS